MVSQGASLSRTRVPRFAHSTAAQATHAEAAFRRTGFCHCFSCVFALGWQPSLTQRSRASFHFVLCRTSLLMSVVAARATRKTAQAVRTMDPAMGANRDIPWSMENARNPPVPKRAPGRLFEGGRVTCTPTVRADSAGGLNANRSGVWPLAEARFTSTRPCTVSWYNCNRCSSNGSCDGCNSGFRLSKGSCSRRL